MTGAMQEAEKPRFIDPYDYWVNALHKAWTTPLTPEELEQARRDLAEEYPRDVREWRTPIPPDWQPGATEPTPTSPSPSTR